MDKEACWKASDQDFINLGLTLRGDMINLKSFCMPEAADSSTKRLRLAQSVKQAGKDRTQSNPSKKMELKMVYLGWFHYDDSKRKYTNVRSNKGGGSRKERFSINADGESILKVLKEMFFPQGKSSFGNLADMRVHLAGSKQEEISTDGFQLQKYISENHFTKTYLYLMSRRKSNTSIMLDSVFNNFLPGSDDEDFDVPSLPRRRVPLSVSSSTLSSASTPLPATSHPIPLPATSHPTPLPGTSSSTPLPATSSSTPLPTFPTLESNVPEMNSSYLIGSNEERQSLRNELDEAYAESLKADVEKDRLESVRSEREARVNLEPQLDEEVVTVTIRHTVLGPTARLFKADDSPSQVYNWVGSLCTHPEYFKLVDFRNTSLTHSSKLESGCYNMVETTQPEYLDLTSNNSTEIYANQEYLLSTLEDLRKLRMAEMDPTEIYLKVSRENVVQDMLDAYGGEKLLFKYKNIKLSFVGENAVGKGVLRDAYSTFFKKLFETWEGNSEFIPSLATDSEFLKCIGKIIVHAYIILDIFPIQVCKASLFYALYESCSDEVLYNSFLAFLTEKERTCIEHFNSSKVDFVASIFHEYKIFAVPTEMNIKKLTIDAANVALVRQPYFLVKSLVHEMNIFKDMGPDLFSQIFALQMVNAEKLIVSLNNEANSNHEEKIMNWLIRYLRNCTHEQVLEILQFITGSCALVIGEQIKVRYVSLTDTQLRPTSQTCFKILYLPRQIASYSELAKIFKTFIHNNDTCWTLYDSGDSD